MNQLLSTLTLFLVLTALPEGAQAQSVASFPFYDGFESGTLAPYWSKTLVFGTGDAKVTTANGPYSGNYHLTVDGNSGTNTNIWVDLAVDLSGKSGVVMDFAWRDYGDEYDSLPLPAMEDGIYISDNGVDFAKIHDLNGPISGESYQQVTLDLDKAVIDNGMGFSSKFIIRLAWSDEFEIATDGFAFDDITLRPLGYTTLGAVQSNQPTLNGQFGAAVTTAADLNGDGFQELVIGHPKYSLSRGRVEFFSGKDYALLNSVTQNLNGDEFGRAVVSVGDLDGDGYSELVVGAPFHDASGSNAGAAFVYSSKTGAKLHSFLGAAAGDEFGSALAAVPDLNGDGFQDLIVGAPRADGVTGIDSGRAYVYSGGDFGL
ncbi:MAG: integrin alpha, partial [Myxococcales bacterium]|nr:integrin alpha [Myxococcales bacterium]